MKIAIGLDIGGTGLRLGVVSELGELLFSSIGSSFSKEDPERLISAIVSAIEDERIKELMRSHEFVGIGIGMAGAIDVENGIVLASPHFPNLKKFPLREKLEAKFSTRVLIDNDANLLALGEAWKGVAKEWRDFLLVAIGTGIGGGFIRNGEIDRGSTGFAGEIGHFCMDRKGPPCPCGSRGCFETLASGSGLKHIIEGNPFYAPLSKLHPNKLGAELFALAKDGYEPALGVYRELGQNLGVGIASLFNVTGLHRFLLAGGFYEAREFFMPALCAEIPHRAYTALFAPQIEICWSTLVPLGGVYGAAKLTLQ